MAQQVRVIFVGEADEFGLMVAVAKGMIIQALLNCVAKALLGEAAATVLKVIGIAQGAGTFV
ncbi:MAG: hypothetical protein HDT39_10755 [Lachnospiraceae bacterium]|nr:hypothetical protein [Lachnospiraceae bacterium]